MLCTPVLYSFIIKEESWMELIASAALLIKNLKTRKQSRKMEIKKCLNLNVHKTNAERSPQEGRAHHSHLIMALMEHFFGICVSSLPLPFVDVLFAGSLFFIPWIGCEGGERWKEKEIWSCLYYATQQQQAAKWWILSIKKWCLFIQENMANSDLEIHDISDRWRISASPSTDNDGSIAHSFFYFLRIRLD